MKKFVFITLALLSFLIGNAQTPLTTEEVINLWNKRYVPPSGEVRETFESIMFKTERDSFAYADVMNWKNVSDSYVATEFDTLQVRILPVKDGNDTTYISAKCTAVDIVGYPNYGYAQNVITVTPFDNSFFDPSDTMTVTVTFDLFTPSGGTNCDSVKVDVLCNSTGSTAESSTVTFVTTSDSWTTYTTTLQINKPLVSPQQPIMVIIAGRVSARNDTFSIANVKTKIYNTNP